MILFKQVPALQKHLQRLRSADTSVGLVPTMGALHDGHLSLIKRAQQTCDVVVCSIFVNPTQFNNASDFEQYPVTTHRDIYLLEKQGCDILFLPSQKEIYPDGSCLQQPYDLGFVETVLEGAYRPGHFQGVCQVVDRLLDIVRPDDLFLGQKDYQQVMVLRRMIELKKHPVQIVTVDTSREETGLARSSRNLRLSEKQKDQATALYMALLFIKENIRSMVMDELKQHASEMLTDAGFQKIDYVAVCNAATLEAVEHFDEETPLVALIAAFMGEVRLIDNMLLN